MKIFGIEKLSLVDFDDKVSCTLFTAGCNFRCGFCHNSALVLSTPETSIDDDYIFSYLKSRKGIIDAVTITGGEPTLQKDLKDYIKRIKELGFLVKLDSNGTNPDVIIDLVNEGLIDYVAIDIKGSKENYKDVVGLASLDMRGIEKTVDFLLENHVDYEFRTTMIKEFHNEETMLKIAKWIKGAKKYRLQKFVASPNCIKQGFNPIEEKDALRLRDIVKDYIKNTELRSY